jgi:L-histidine N-alpha-methyltransferase
MPTGTLFTIEPHLLPDFTRDALARDARIGLTSIPRSLPSKWLYDARGSELFEDITRLPEYYPTRAERQILDRYAAEIVEGCSGRSLVELGSGSSIKTRLLLDAMRANGGPTEFVMLDVSEPALLDAGRAMAEAYPDLPIHAMVADFEHHLELIPPAEGRLVIFLGSTIGNFEPESRAVFLRSLRAALDPGDLFLLGADLVKPESVLVAAYDDAQGITAQFNLNVLEVLNRGLGADFRLDRFAHHAVWSTQDEWIEMRLRSLVSQRVRIRDLDLEIELKADEEIRTEISAKFRREGLLSECAAAGFNGRGWWTDERDWFSLSLWEAV